MQLEQPNGLALEYQREYGSARGYIDVSNLINNPAANGKCRVFGLSLEKQLTHLSVLELGPLFDDGPDPLLVRFDT